MERARPWLALLCAAVVLGSMTAWVDAHRSGRIGYGGLLLEPEAWDGRDVALSLVRVSAVDGTDRYRVRKGGTELAVQGPTDGLEVGAELSLGGTWRATGPHLEVAWVEHRGAGRRSKRVLGLVGLVLIAGLAVGSVGIERGGLVLRG